MILRQKLHKARTANVHGFLPQELLSFALPAARTREFAWRRVNGARTFTVTAGVLNDSRSDRICEPELPSGKYARAALMYLCTQAKLTNTSTINVSESYRSFTQALGLEWQGASAGKEALRQLMLVSSATFTIEESIVDPETDKEHYSDQGARFSSGMSLWMEAGRARFSEQGESIITLSPQMMEMLERAAPISMKAWRWLLVNSRSPMALDVYTWLCGRLFRCEHHTRVSWQQLYDQFGSTAPTKRFKQHFRKALETALLVYPEAQIKEDFGTSRVRGFKGFHLSPSPDPRDSKTPEEV